MVCLTIQRLWYLNSILMNEYKMDEVLEESIAVAVRIRPMQPREIDIGAESIWEVPNLNSLNERGVDKFFVYDRVFDSSCSNQQVFDEFAEKIVWNTMEGYNG